MNKKSYKNFFVKFKMFNQKTVAYHLNATFIAFFTFYFFYSQKSNSVNESQMGENEKQMCKSLKFQLRKKR